MRPPPFVLLFALAVSSSAPGLRAETHRFVPTRFSTTFSASLTPVLRIKSGDSVETKTADARGSGADGRSMAGSPPPQTGPFFIDGAEPGDLLVVTIGRLEPAQPIGYSTGGMASGVLPPAALSVRPDTSRYGWAIDRGRGVVRLDLPSAMPGVDWRSRFADASFEMPLRPALGSLGVAPAGDQALDAFATGAFGGNLTAAALEPGARVMLPVLQPGALLFLGHGLARKGDGMAAGTGIETSLDVAFSVEVVKKRSWPHSSVVRGSTVVGEFPMGAPRVETGTHLMAIGSGTSLQQALQQATYELHHWLDDDFGLNERSVSVFLGQALEYEIASVTEPNVTVVAKVRKAYLPRPSAEP